MLALPSEHPPGLAPSLRSARSPSGADRPAPAVPYREGEPPCTTLRPPQQPSPPRLLSAPKRSANATSPTAAYWVAGDLDGARGRSLFVRLHGPGAQGKWTDAAVGSHGDLLDLIRHRTGAPTLRAALDEARAVLALPASPAAGDAGDYDAAQAARRLWRGCRALDGTHAEAYLRARGLARCRFPALRFHPELRYREGSSVIRLPALVAAVTGDDGAVCGVHRTWLHPRRPAKADVASPRKALGRIYGLAVRFGMPAGDVAPLLVGEGIETVLSLVTAVPEITAAAALSAGSLGAFSPPSACRRLVIARDNDFEGAWAAERLARRCARAGVAAAVIVPEGGDFNDDLASLGAAVLAARLGPLFRSTGPREERA